jgi:TPR repeat protein
VAAATAATTGAAAAFERCIEAARAAAAEGLEQERRQTAAGASGSRGNNAATDTAAEPATETAPPLSPPSAQTAAIKEERTAAATAGVSEEATAAPTHASDRAALLHRLKMFAEDTVVDMTEDIESWVASEFSGDWAAVAAAAEGGNGKAQFAMGSACTCARHISREQKCGWIQRVMDQGHLDTYLLMVAGAVTRTWGEEEGGVSTIERDKDGVATVMKFLKLPLASGSAPAQYVKGMLLYIFDCDSGIQEDFLDAARWIRKAAKQGRLPEAQYELGEMFRRGLFCDVHNMRFAREYLQRAARQGHAEAVDCMKELCSCAFCGAADAPWKCGFCHQAMYCDYATCCVKHWREGGGVGGGIIMDAGARHKKVFPRTHTTDESDEEDEEEEEYETT